MELRALTADDEEDLLALHRACPIEADFTFFFDRGPRFFAWPGAVFERHAYMGGFEGGRLVACALLGIAAGDGPDGAFAYAGDARVLPAARGQEFSQRAAAALVPLLAPTGAVVALVKRGNETAAGALASFAGPLAVARLCGFRAVNLLLIRRPPAPVRYQVRRARAEDLPVLAELMARAARGRPFALPASVEALRQDLARLPGLALDDFYLAFAGGEPVGALGAWESDPVRRVHLLRYSWRGQLARAGYAIARRLSPGAAPLPAAGGSFRTVTTTRVAVPSRDPAVLHDLLAAVCRDRFGRGFHMVHVGFAEGDPLLPAVRGFPRQAFVSDLVMLANRADPRVPGRGPPLLDLRFF